ncbi:MAG: hypothetical protein JXR07_13005 [Reichenbachiella sp.]
MEPFYTLNPIDFSNLEDNQKSYYIDYESACESISNDFSQKGDTLVLEVEEHDERIYFKEYLTQFSASENKDTIKYEIHINDDYLLIPDRRNSALFFFYGNDTIHLNSSNRVSLRQSKCRMFINQDVFIGEEIGFIDSFELGPYTIENKTAVSCVPEILNLEAYLIYDAHGLFASHSILTGQNVEVEGWIRI